ncbi:MAG: hypothetical protein R2909_02105 [Gemmatimonadales bacterium]
MNSRPRSTLMFLSRAIRAPTIASAPTWLLNALVLATPTSGPARR